MLGPKLLFNRIEIDLFDESTVTNFEDLFLADTCFLQCVVRNIYCLGINGSVNGDDEDKTMMCG